jgi:hypothetical protein
MLELVAAAAGTTIVAAGFLEGGPCLAYCDPIHNVRRRAMRGEFRRHEAHIGIDVPEEHFVAGAEVIETGLAVGCVQKAMLGALAVGSPPCHAKLTTGASWAAMYWRI